MNPTRIAPAIAGAVMVAMLILIPATPANAAAVASIAITAPGKGTAFSTGSVTITGNAGINGQLLETNTVTDVSISVVPSVSGASVSCDLSSCGASKGAASTNFSFPTPALAYNGPYGVTASVTADECTVLTCYARTGSATTNFTVAVPPVAPRGVTTKVSSDGSVTVSWDANPEPDLYGYQVQRGGGPGNGAVQTVSSFQKTTTFTDNTTGAGGQYAYVVTAFRPGADGTSNTVMLTSAAAVMAEVPIPPSSSTTVPVGGAPVTTTTLLAPPSSAAPNISAFLGQAAQAGALAPKPKVVAPVSSTPRVVIPTPSASSANTTPNTFAPTLPYPVTTPSTVVPGAGSTHIPLSGSPEPSSHKSQPVYYYVAGGAVLCALGIGLRFANKRTNPAPLETLPHEDEAGAARPVSSGAPTVVTPVVAASFAAKAAARIAAAKGADVPAVGASAGFRDAVGARGASTGSGTRAPFDVMEAPGGVGRSAVAASGLRGGAPSTDLAPPAAAPAVGAVPVAQEAPVERPRGARRYSDPPPSVPRRPDLATTLSDVALDPAVASPRSPDGKPWPAAEEAVDYFRLIQKK